MVDKIRIKRQAGTPSERETETTLQDAMKDVGSYPEWVPDTTLTLTQKHQGRCLIFTNPCVVTIPAGLRADFSCGFVQGGAGVVSFVADGVIVNSFEGQKKTAGQWSASAICGIDAGSYLLYGGLAA